MKRTLIILSLFTFSFSFLTSSAQTWKWVDAETNSGYMPASYSWGVATDSAGNVYQGGAWHGTNTFGSYTLSTCYCEQNIFLVKTDPNGNVLWAKGSTTSSALQGNQCFAVATDRHANVFETGFFNDDMEFGTDTVKAIANSYWCAYLVKYDANGNVLWANAGVHKNYSGDVIGYSVATDFAGSVYMAGIFNDTVYFANDTVISVGSTGYLAKYDANGNLVWLKTVVKPNNNADSVVYTTVTVDKGGNIYFAGIYRDSVSFGATTLTTGGSQFATFLAKYNSAGVLQWAKGSTLPNASSYVGAGYGNDLSLGVNSAGDIYMAGSYDDSIRFGPYSVGDAKDNTNAFLVKYASSGKVDWVKTSTNPHTGPDANFVQMGNVLSIDKGDNIYECGTFDSNSITFGTTTLNAKGSYPAYLIKLDSSGTVICGSEVNMNGYVNTIAADPTSNAVYFAGDIGTSPCSFGTINVTGATGCSFVSKWTCGTAGLNELATNSEVVMVYPNPSNGVFTIEQRAEKESEVIEVYNMLGEKVYSQTFSIQNATFKIDLSSQPNGVYLYRIISDSGESIGSGKLIINK